MVEFKEDNKQSTTGNGKFLNTIEGIDCESYHIDPPPHDGEYFHSQLKAANSYFRSVSYDEFGIDTISPVEVVGSSAIGSSIGIVASSVLSKVILGISYNVLPGLINISQPSPR